LRYPSIDRLKRLLRVRKKIDGALLLVTIIFCRRVVFINIYLSPILSLIQNYKLEIKLMWILGDTFNYEKNPTHTED